MSTFKNFMALATLVLLTAVFGAATFSEAFAPVSPVVVFTPEDASAWHLEVLANIPADGQHLMATLKRNRTEVVVIVGSGRISEIGIVPHGGAYQALNPSGVPCNPLVACGSTVRYYTLDGQCFAVCGRWK